MDFGLPVELPRTASQNKSGAQKRRQRAQLPRFFFLYDRTSRLVHGGAVFTSVVKLANTTEAEWVVCRGAPLQTAVAITPDMCAYSRAVFKLKPTAECDLRLANARVGGPLSDHFPEFVHALHLCFTLPLVDIDQSMLDPGRATSVRTPAAYVRLCGIEAATVVAALPIAAAEHDVDEEAPDSGGAPEAPQPANAPAASSSSAQCSTAILQGLYTVQPQGLVTHRYHVRGLLQYLALAQNLKPSASVSDVLATSAQILLGPQGAGLATSIRSLHSVLLLSIMSLKSCSSCCLEIPSWRPPSKNCL